MSSTHAQHLTLSFNLFNIITIIVQVAFGMDFAEQWNDKNLGLKWTKDKSDGLLLFLTRHAFEGLELSFRYPWIQVCSYRLDTLVTITFKFKH